MKKEIIERIKELLEENDYRKFQKTETCSVRSGNIINLKTMTFREVFDYVKEACGFGECYEEYDFIKDKEKSRYLENIFNDYVESIFNDEDDVDERLDYYNQEVDKVFEELKSSDIDANLGDYELVKIELEDDIEDDEENNFILISSTPEREPRYRDYLAYNKVDDCLNVIDNNYNIKE